MPNWCWNNAIITHDDKAAIDKIEEAIKNEGLFTTFMPEGNWGTKWDVSELSDSNRDSDNEISLFFDTAWSPPSGFYATMAEKGYTIDASFLEEGIGFVGYWNNDEGEESWDFYKLFDEYGDEYAKHLPEDMAELVEWAYENWKEWQNFPEENKGQLN